MSDQSTHSTGSESPRRRWPRVEASALNGLTASIVAGPSVTLIDLSRGGAQIEVAARYPMQAKVRLKLTRTTGEVKQFAGTVCWAKVATIIDGKIHYRLGVGFETPIEDFIGLAGVDDQLTPIPAPPSSLPEASAGPIHPPVAPVASDASADADSPPRGVVTTFPLAHRANRTGADTSAAASTPETTALDQGTIELRATLERTSAELARLQGAHSELTTQLQDGESERLKLQDELRSAREQWHEERTDLLRSAEAAADLRVRVEEALADRARVQAEHDDLAAQLQDRATERLTLQSELIASRQEQQGWLDERAALQARTSADAAELEAIRAALQSREQEYTQAMAEHQARFDAIVSELMQTANEQQAEYQQLLDDRMTVIDEQKARAEHAEGELERTRRESHGQLAALQTKCREFETRLAVAEAAAAEYESRNHAIRREAERLLATILSASAVTGHHHESNIDLTGPDRSQAVAGG